MLSDAVERCTSFFPHLPLILAAPSMAEPDAIPMDVDETRAVGQGEYTVQFTDGTKHLSGWPWYISSGERETDSDGR